MFVPPSIFPPPIYPGNFPRYLFQVLSVNLPLNLHSVPGSYPRYISQVLPDNLPGLLSWMAGGNDSSNCCISFVPGHLSLSCSFSLSMLCEKYENIKKQVDSAPPVHIDDVYITGILRQVQRKISRKNRLDLLKIFESFRRPM